jgi:hypothetical protein
MPSPDTADLTVLPGVVVYRRRGAGELDAVWRSQRGSGAGFATGGPPAGFVGRFRVRYTDQDGGDSGAFDLSIAPEGDGYRLTWSAGGATLFEGVGIQLDHDTLVASYARAVDPM